MDEHLHICSFCAQSRECIEFATIRLQNGQIWVFYMCRECSRKTDRAIRTRWEETGRPLETENAEEVEGT